MLFFTMIMASVICILELREAEENDATADSMMATQKGNEGVDGEPDGDVGRLQRRISSSLVLKEAALVHSKLNEAEVEMI